MSSWFAWSKKSEEVSTPSPAKAEQQPLFKDGIYTKDSSEKVTTLSFEDILRETNPKIAEHYDPAEPKRSLDEAIEEAKVQADTAAELTAKAKEAAIGSDGYGEQEAADVAAAAAETAEKNVRKLAAAFETNPDVTIPTWGAGTGWYKPPKTTTESSTSASAPLLPNAYDFYEPSVSKEDVVIDTEYLPPQPLPEPSSQLELNVDIPADPTPLIAPEPDPEAAPYVTVEPEAQIAVESIPEASTSQAPMYPVITTNGQVNPSQGRSRQGQAHRHGNGNGREDDGIEAVEDGRVPSTRRSSTLRDPLLEPFLPGAREQLRRWKRFLGWGEQLAGESILDDVRLSSLDVFRGLAVAGFIVVADSGARFPVLNNSAWEGLSFGDFVDPFFLFIVGVSVAISFKRVPSRRHALYKIIVRALKIFIIGLFIQGGYFHGPTSLTFGVSLTELRYSGVLQRVAIAFFVVGLSEVAVMKRYRDTPPEGFLQLIFRFMLHWGIAVLLALLYLGCTYFLYVPDWTFTVSESTGVLGPLIRFVPPISSNVTSLLVKCGVTGDFGPACNAAAYIDRSLLGLDHMSHRPAYQYSKACSAKAPYPGPLPIDAPAWCEAPFDAEGIMGTLGGVLTVFAGLHFGHVLTHFRQHWVRLSHASIFSASLLAAGWGLQFPLKAKLHRLFPSFPDWLILDYNGMPFNKQLYSLSFMLFTAGVAGLSLCVIYILTDVLKVRFYTKLFEWIGRNPLLVFVLAACGAFEALIAGFYWETPDNNLMTFLQSFISSRLVENLDYANLLGTALKVSCWAIIAGVLACNGHTWNF